MGSKYSKTTKDEVVNIEPQIWGNMIDTSSLKYDKNVTDSFSAMNKTQENTESTVVSNNKETENDKTSQQLYPYKFEWNGLGSVVILAGSFLGNWTNYKPMIKNPETEKFETIVYLPKGKHYFKFIVDKNWVCSSQYQTTLDAHHNQNNFIDLTNYVPPESLVRQEEYKKGELKPHRSKVIILENTARARKNSYNSKYPLIHELNISAPSVITHYKHPFNINYMSNQEKFQDSVSKKICLIYKEKNIITENITFKKILPCPHEKLMHYCQNIDDIKDKTKKYLKGCTTIRNKHKYLTVVYFKPKYKQKEIENNNLMICR